MAGPMATTKTTGSRLKLWIAKEDDQAPAEHPEGFGILMAE
jgi:hypothetical protein